MARSKRSGRWLSISLVASALLLVLVANPASAQSRRYGGAGITLFTNPNFGGQSASFRDDTPDLRNYGLNDQVSSIEVAPGESWEICQDINFGNRCQVISGSVSDLRQMGWNDRISSVRRVGGYNNGGGYYGQPRGTYNNYRPELVIYDRAGYRGTSRVLTDQNGNFRSFGNRGGSVQVRSGTWELCDDTGRCTTVSQNVSDLSRVGLTGRITSVRPVADNYYDNRPGRGRGRGYGRYRQDR
jgi:Beta/Gamma crystallin